MKLLLRAGRSLPLFFEMREKGFSKLTSMGFVELYILMEKYFITLNAPGAI